MPQDYTYLALLGGSILFPLILSFDKKVAFYKNWKALFPAVFIVAAFFIIWDVWFTHVGIWHFNPNYVLGYYLFGLPVEEWLFFFVIPYCCVFIYEVIKAYWSNREFAIFSSNFSIIISIVLIIIAAIYYDQLYTFVNFILTSIVLFALSQSKFFNKYSGYFYVSYFVSLIPFFLVNGVLTSMPVVEYNNAENLSLRAGTIPVEDFIYLLLLLIGNVYLYEVFKKKLKTE